MAPGSAAITMGLPVSSMHQHDGPGPIVFQQAAEFDPEERIDLLLRDLRDSRE
jgi:hypothetical protein